MLNTGTRSVRRVLLSAALAAGAAGVVVASAPQAPAFMAIDDVRPGMVGTGRTVFSGDRIEDFKVEIIGVMRNVIGPRRDLILARLSGGPLATTGVIQGMSGSPVYIDGKLVGAVSYSLGSFPKEPIAGITPIGEMTAAVDSQAARVTDRSLSLTWPAASAEVFAVIGRLVARASSPIGTLPWDTRIVGPQNLADTAPQLRPIGAAMVIGGFDPEIDQDLRHVLTGQVLQQSAGPRAAVPETPLRPGDPIGMSLVRGDLQMGATGTVTHVDGSRVYAFGHPFLNLGPTSIAMTRAQVFTVLPSLETSSKLATLGDVIGVMNQDRSTAVGGVLGPGPREVEVHLSMVSERAQPRTFTFYVLQDQTLTPLFTYVAVINALTAYERQTGAMSVSARGTISLGFDGQIAVDDVFSGDTAATAAAAALATPLASVVTNEFRKITPERVDLELRTSERQEGTTIERVWLDTTRPRFGATHRLQIQLQDYRGGKQVVEMPVAMPSHAEGPLTLLVSDAANLTGLEQHELRPGRPTNWAELLTELNRTNRNNRVYVRLIATSSGTVVAGDTLPALPASVRSILDADPTVSSKPVTRTVVGSWDRPLTLAVHGSRELTLTLTAQ